MAQVKVKICGMKTTQDIEIVNEFLPDYVGFVFAGTKRLVTDEQASAMKQLLDSRIQTVGVFVNEPIEHIVNLCKRGIIDLVQLHGDETDEDVFHIRSYVKTPILQVIRVQTSQFPLEKLTTKADYLLFDTYKAGVYGGSGERFSIQLLQQALNQWCKEGNVLPPYFIAGGLTPENVGAVVSQTDCYGIDISSGVETQGHKDAEKIRRLMNLHCFQNNRY